MSKSTYEYHRVKKNNDKYAWEKILITHIFDESKETYGYRRVKLVLSRQEGVQLSGKTVLKLMNELNIHPIQRKKGHYNSYKKQNTQPEPNLLGRNFSSNIGYAKLVSDVTQFEVAGRKVYLSPLIDLFNGEIIGHSVATSPTVEFVNKMFEGIKDKIPNKISPIVHTDQGLQYWHKSFKVQLEKIGAIQSMSRKANCQDNAPAESFFGHLKSEFFYRNSFKTIDDFIIRLNEYIHWYNNYRVRCDLDGMSPIEYRKCHQLMYC